MSDSFITQSTAEVGKSSLRSLASKARWANPVLRARMTEKIKVSHNTPEFRERHSKLVSEGIQRAKLSPDYHPRKRNPHSEQTRQRISAAKKGKPVHPSIHAGGKKWREEHRQEIIDRTKKQIADGRSAFGKKGKDAPFWAGGLTSANKMARQCPEYIEWRKQVFALDNYTCVWCGQHGMRLHAHHVRPFATHPQLRFEVANGVTLCEECHGIAHGRSLTIAASD